MDNSSELWGHPKGRRIGEVVRTYLDKSRQAHAENVCDAKERGDQKGL